MANLFLSHTKLDENFCNRFDRAAAREGIKIYRSEFEEIESPPWKTIKNEIEKSNALFLIVGNELIQAQEKSDLYAHEREKWKFTQNWISYEVGVACQKGIDVWVVCDSLDINFPVPYVTNYEIHGLQAEGELLNWYRNVFKTYNDGSSYPLGVFFNKFRIACPYETCGTIVNFFSIMPIGSTTKCPSCLRDWRFEKGWLL